MQSPQLGRIRSQRLLLPLQGSQAVRAWFIEISFGVLGVVTEFPFGEKDMATTWHVTAANGATGVSRRTGDGNESLSCGLRLFHPWMKEEEKSQWAQGGSNRLSDNDVGTKRTERTKAS